MYGLREIVMPAIIFFQEISVLLNDMMEGRMPKIPVPDPI